MNVIENNNVTAFDVDNTLVMWPKDFRSYKDDRIYLVYGDEPVYLEEHSYHTTFLKNCHGRGDHIIVWSQNGHAWALQVVKKLGLQDYVHLVMNKPTRHVDDKDDVASIVGNHIYIPHETYEGPK